MEAHFSIVSHIVLR